MRTIIAGSRSITRHGLVRAAIVASGWADNITEVVSGCARGVDQIGELWAHEKGVSVQKFPADWKTHGKAAGPIRNEQMAAYADALIAVWDGISTGTADMIKRARQHGLHVYIHQETKPMQVAPLPPITAAERAAVQVTEYALLCRDCGVAFISTDPDRKWCDAHLCERINGAGILEDDDDEDDLFTEYTLACQGCGVTFTTTNPRAGQRCAECNAGLKVKVACPACDLEHIVPILSDTKLCGPCRVDPELTLAHARNRAGDAFADAQAATTRMIDTYDAATFDDQARYDAAQEKRKGWAAHRWQAAYTAAVAKQDGLAPLLIARDACDRATAALEAAQAVLRAVEEYRR